MKWVIYYGDDTTVNDGQLLPADVPKRNVQVIAQEDADCGQHFLRSNDYYWWNGIHWEGGDLFGLYDYLIDPGYKVVLFGRTVTNNEYQTIYNRALAGSEYLPRKSARREWERKP
jgi:hypothetical protein